jgi:hypothetical protein
MKGLARVALFVAIGIAAGAGAFRLASRTGYRASVTIVVTNLQPPAHHVAAPEAAAGERLSEIAASTMSPVRLERLIQELNLFEIERREMPMERVKELMRQQIAIEVHPLNTSSDAVEFSLAFRAADARALRVIERLAMLFMYENFADSQDPFPELREHFEIADGPRITNRHQCHRNGPFS